MSSLTTDPTGPCVLLVDDVPAQRDIYRTILEHGGYAVLEAADGDSAISMAQVHLPSLILLDMGLPGLSGWEVARRLKESPQTSAICIVGLSGHALPEHRAKAEEAGCDAYLTKPIEPKTVLEFVRQQIGSFEHA